VMPVTSAGLSLSVAGTRVRLRRPRVASCARQLTSLASSVASCSAGDSHSFSPFSFRTAYPSLLAICARSRCSRNLQNRTTLSRPKGVDRPNYAERWRPALERRSMHSSTQTPWHISRAKSASRSFSSEVDRSSGVNAWPA
jgi:hypothetical protein